MGETMKHTTLDFERQERQGFPEVVYCEGKTIDQCIDIFKELDKVYPLFMGTRASKELYERAKGEIPHLQYDEMGRIIYKADAWPCTNGDRLILVVTAGTSDMKVAEEAYLTAKLMGNRVERLYDVGVAGIHRILEAKPLLDEANVIIVAAGMEGALASVVGGLVKVPVIAVPTSVGYGANFEGLSALLGMINSCAAGIGVVNIDNGFGAARLAHTINSRR